jgi:hypothetical protein
MSGKLQRETIFISTIDIRGQVINIKPIGCTAEGGTSYRGVQYFIAFQASRQRRSTYHVMIADPSRLRSARSVGAAYCTPRQVSFSN